ncbi:helix-turn-helix domain-containing protein [Melghirimyces algeriensis]|uniref:Transcriptional regulator, XRE family with cupin sensor n=1 Tax=Melghirimyces algeriensis TaxID=910412 RepID=A0A521AC51_9BACL|nr:XRE family transcriptional regulator [Melghirimyces algeriensis]SMO32358.1 transcriptional regulator, XRE family with cupin sensor [Melghirimyces algeriensis]
MNIGQRLKQYRLQKGYSLQALSDRSGVSRSMLSKIERGEKNPTINLLCEIVEALQITVSQVIDEPTQREVIVIKKDQRPVLYDKDSGLERHLLSPTFPSKGIEFVLNVLPEGHRTGRFPAHQKHVREHIFVETGKLKVILGRNDHYTLEAGDSFYFEANIEHEFINIGKTDCRYFLVIDSHLFGGS